MPGKDGRKRQVLYDTSMIIGYLRGKRNCKSKVEQVRNGKIIGFVSVITVFELYIGAFLASKSSEALKELSRSNELIELNDLFIGGTAVTLGLPVSTINRSHFSRIPKLKILD